MEDIVLFAWVAFVQPLTIGNQTHAISEFGGQGTLIGIAYLVAAAGALLCLASRSSDEATLAWTTASSPHSYAPLPFVIAIAILAAFGLESVGAMGAEVSFVPAFVLALGLYFLYSHLPTLPRQARRALTVPMSIVGSAVFNGIMFEMFSTIERAAFVDVGVGLLLFLLMMSALFYFVFIFSPSQIADAGGSWLDWGARYALFFAGSIIGITMLGANRA